RDAFLDESFTRRSSSKGSHARNTFHRSGGGPCCSSLQFDASSRWSLGLPSRHRCLQRISPFSAAETRAAPVRVTTALCARQSPVRRRATRSGSPREKIG